MNTTSASIVIPSYESGEYYSTHKDPDQDSPFKANAFLSLLSGIQRNRHLEIDSYADVGCGGGGLAEIVSTRLRDGGYNLHAASGYDVSPHVLSIRKPGVDFYFEDFCQADKHYSLVTLFDVVEHVPEPQQFLRNVAAKSDFIALHLPLDRSLVNCFFDRFHHRLRYPGHVVMLDPVDALNLVTMAGLMPIDYSYTHGYAAPSGGMTTMQRLARPMRSAIAHISPWLASRTIGGVSLMIIAATQTGLKKMKF